jgi:hypothetical protein
VRPLAFVGRIIVIAFAVMVACAAAGIAIAIGVLGADWPALSGDFGERAGFWFVALFASSFTGGAALLPAFILIVLAEAYSVRSLLAHAVAGTVLLMMVYYGLGFGDTVGESIDAPPPLMSRSAEIAAAAGAVFGLAYWLIAGRNAGRWRQPSSPSIVARKQ